MQIKHFKFDSNLYSPKSTRVDKKELLMLAATLCHTAAQ